MNLRSWAALLAAIALLACNSTGVGNPAPELALALTSDPEPEPDASDPEQELAPRAVSHAVLVFAELRWLPCSSENEAVVVPGPMLVDLVTGRVEPPPPSVLVPEGGFCGIDAPLTPAQSPAALTGRSVFFSGERDDGTLFLLYANMVGTVRIRARTGVVWDTDTAPALLWAFRPLRWLDRSELDAEASAPLVQNRRVIAIDVNRHELLYEAIRNNIGGRSSLYGDRNANGRLDPDERADHNWLGEGLAGLD
jgi:hypothetical protein